MNFLPTFGNSCEASGSISFWDGDGTCKSCTDRVEGCVGRGWGRGNVAILAMAKSYALRLFYPHETLGPAQQCQLSLMESRLTAL